MGVHEQYTALTAQLTPSAVSSQVNILPLSAISGLLAHQYFKRFEPDPISYSQFTSTIAVCLGWFFYHYLRSITAAALYTIEVLVILNVVQLVSIVIYRLSPWHPLAKYPGPWAAKVSKIYWWRESRLGRTSFTQAALHKQYGEFVRFGPNWVSVLSVDAIPIVYGGSRFGRTPWMKSDWYDGAVRGAKRISLHQEVDMLKHHARRKVWDHGFTGKAIADYKPEILEFISKLERNVAAVEAQPGKTIDMGLQSNFFSFDVMGVLAFGEPFGMLDAGEKHFFMQTLEEAMQALFPFSELPWLRIIFARCLPIPARLKRFEKQNIERFERRLAQGSSRRDIFTYLLGEEKDEGGQTIKFTRMELIADTGLVVVAGSDTTSSLLSWFWYYNTLNPASYARLREELSQLKPEQLTDTALLSKLPYLNAALNETLRMQPAVGGGLRRVVPPGGFELDGHYLPERTVVCVPGYAIHHDPRYWGDDCDTYRPERWLDESGRYDKNAFNPFGFGSRSCPGKGLAFTEARLAVAGLATKFEFAFPDDFDRRKFEESVRDHFTIQYGPLLLIPKRSPVVLAS